MFYLCTAPDALTLFPLAWMVMASFMHPGETSGYTPAMAPERAEPRSIQAAFR